MRFSYESRFSAAFFYLNPKHSFVILAPKFHTKNINVLPDNFLYKILALKITKLRFAFVQNFGTKNAFLYEKRAHKMLMKLTLAFKILF
jgi:hypothetical protein